MTFLPKKCEECNGSGWVRIASSWDEGDVVPDICWECNGTGDYQESEPFSDADIDAQGALQ